MMDGSDIPAKIGTFTPFGHAAARAIARGLTAGMEPSERKECLTHLYEVALLAGTDLETLIKQIGLEDA